MVRASTPRMGRSRRSDPVRRSARAGMSAARTGGSTRMASLARIDHHRRAVAAFVTERLHRLVIGRKPGAELRVAGLPERQIPVVMDHHVLRLVVLDAPGLVVLREVPGDLWLDEAVKVDYRAV